MDPIRPLYAARVTNTVSLSAVPHTHDFHQFLYIFRGRCSMGCDGTKFTVRARQLAIIKPGTEHAFDFPKKDEMLCDIFQMKCRVTDDIIGEAAVPMIVDCTARRGEVESACDLMVRASEGGGPVERAMGGLLRYLFAMLESLSRETETTAVDARIRRVLAAIDAHPERPISVRALAEAASLNESYFIRLFRRNTGKSPSEYAIHRRMEHARAMLVFSSATLAEIARNAGYNNYHHFSNQFTKAFGMRPRDYRERSGMSAQ
ncbi:MAG: AraC family transcriptional regulator [Spirochaetota bacterium]